MIAKTNVFCHTNESFFFGTDNIYEFKSKSGVC